MTALPDGYEFALCLTHDVDRPYKTFQAPYYAVVERDLGHLRALLSTERPYWQFETIMSLEAELGVRSSFYFLDEQSLFADRPVTDWVRPSRWKLYAGRYDVTEPAIRAVIDRLDDGGWEVGLHGSYESVDDPDRLREEKATLERVLGRRVLGGRQHYLNLSIPDTWKHHAAIGLRYDATPRPERVREADGAGVGPVGLYRPFDDAFVVFPLTLMDVGLAPSNVAVDVEACWRRCESRLRDARESGHVMTVCWHPRYFNRAEFPGYTELYVDLVERAKELGAWVGPCGDFYERFLADESTLTGR